MQLILVHIMKNEIFDFCVFIWSMEKNKKNVDFTLYSVSVTFSR